MKAWFCAFICIVIAAGNWRVPALAQSGQDGVVTVPSSSVEHPGDLGRRAHTNHLIRWLPEATTGPAGLTPNEARTAYNLPPYTGAAAGSQIIAIVDAYDYPTARSDFNEFAETFGLPQEVGDGSVFEVVYATGAQPSYNTGWSQEAALDIEWAHAMAPTAKIVLVEAASSSFADLLDAVRVASSIPGVREVSMSWGGTEFRAETSWDIAFTADGVVYVACSGDTGGKAIWPGTSPNAVSAGGTTLNFDSLGNFISETGWSGSGGGASKYELRPSYQDGIPTIAGKNRGVPDLSFDADPNTGVSVYWQGSWLVFGGTSVSAPALAGVINLAAASGSGFAADSYSELTRIYANLADSSASPGSTSDFRDIVSGKAGRYRCSPSWDFVTGVGSSWGLSGK
jgi:kumamolisin